MVQRGQDFRLALKAREPLGISRHRLRKDLDGHLPLEVGVRRPVHLPHAADAKLAGNLVGTDSRAG